MPKLGFIFISAFMLLFSGPTLGTTPSNSVDRNEIAALPPIHRQALVIMVAVLLEQNSKNLEMNTTEERTDAAKVVATENLAMSWLARDAGWPEMQQYYEDAAKYLARVIRGDVKGETILVKARELEDRRKALMLSAITRIEQAGVSENDPKLVALAAKLKVEIASRARISVWGRPPGK